MNVPGKAGEDLLLVGAEACVLADGQDLTPRWTFRVAQVFRCVLLQRPARLTSRLCSLSLGNPGMRPMRIVEVSVCWTEASCLCPGAAPPKRSC